MFNPISHVKRGTLRINAFLAYKLGLKIFARDYLSLSIHISLVIHSVADAEPEKVIVAKHLKGVSPEQQLAEYSWASSTSTQLNTIQCHVMHCRKREILIRSTQLIIPSTCGVSHFRALFVYEGDQNYPILQEVFHLSYRW